MVTPIQGQPTATVDQAITRAKVGVEGSYLKHPVLVVQYINELWRLCEEVGYDPAVLFAQATHETGTFSSQPWESYLNPAGIGVFDGSNRVGMFANGIDAARAHVIHMAAYIHGPGSWAHSSRYVGLDPSYYQAIRHPKAGTVKHVEDLGNGTWASDPNYTEKVLAHYAKLTGESSAPNEPEPEEPETPTKPDTELIDLPGMVEWIPSPNSHSRPGGMNPLAIVHHITADMSMSNVINWFNNPESDASSHFVIDRNGHIVQMVSSKRSAWTNGDYQGYRTDIPWLVEAIRRCDRGLNNLNDFTITIEHIGTPENPPTQSQYKAGQKIMRYFGHPDTYEIRFDRATQNRHADINSISRFYCPGPNFNLEGQIVSQGGDPTGMNYTLKDLGYNG